jgi:hypothetical protein
MANHQNDTLTKYGAEILVEQIVSYWRSRGYHGIDVRAYKFIDRNDKGQESLCYGIRSNIRPNGYPPRHRRKVC